MPGEATRLERAGAACAGSKRRTLAACNRCCLERAVGPASGIPALAPPQVSAVLVTLQPGADAAQVAATLATWPDVTVYSTQQQIDLLLSGMVDKARRQLGLFRVLLIIISTIIMALIIYTLTLDKIHDIAMLKLMGARNGVIVGLILQQALLIGALGYGLAYWLGTFAFPRFPRLVVIETPDLLIARRHRAGHFRAGQPARHLEGHARRTEQGVVVMNADRLPTRPPSKPSTSRRSMAAATPRSWP